MKKILTVLIFLVSVLTAQQVKILESNDKELKIEVDFSNIYSINDTLIDGVKFDKIDGGDIPLREEGEPWLPAYTVRVGLPGEELPEIEVNNVEQTVYKNKFILPYPELTETREEGRLVFSEKVYGTNSFYPSSYVTAGGKFRYRYSDIGGLVVNPFRFNPVTRELQFAKKITFTVRYQSLSRGNEIFAQDAETDRFLENLTLNPEISKQWKKKAVNFTDRSTSDHWYDPSKQWIKIKITNKDVYRITWQKLYSAGLISRETIKSESIQMFNAGGEIPLEVFDGKDGEFNPGDYFQFAGDKIKPSQYCAQNIYETQNIYWLTVEGSEGLRYIEKNGYPVSYDVTTKQHIATVHYEQDQIFERLGYAPNGKRDYWFWGKASGSKGTVNKYFENSFLRWPDNSSDNFSVTLRVNMQGITNIDRRNPDHRARIAITDQPVGSITWDGQNSVTFEKQFTMMSDIVIYGDGNKMQIYADGGGEVDTVDEIRINWYEFDYWKFNRVNGNHFFFTSAQEHTGKVRFVLWYWTEQTAKAYVPEKNEVIKNFLISNDQYQNIFFVDTVQKRTDYYVVADNYFAEPDTMYLDESSALRNAQDGADYIIITHKNFYTAAEELADYRRQNYPGIDNPRIKIVRIQDIYDEFSNGFLDPYAVKEFTAYAFENWPSPAPSALVLLGDMSWDYRGLLSDSRPNFIPAIPQHTVQYGLAVSDNLFAAVSGSDYVMDMAIGRLSCETLEEARILVNKVKNYPGDDGKMWKQDVLLIGAGQNYDDENSFGFNDQSVYLQNIYIDPAGYNSDKIFRYPNREEYGQFQGDGPEIRNSIDQGKAFVNFYGHGGGYQWDLVFLDDDIHELKNGFRQPFISSVTCYTAHFDNQNVFGEIFNKAPGKGSIGFWGNSGLTFWLYGVRINNELFRSVFSYGTRGIGKALMKAHANFASHGLNSIVEDKLACFTLLGEPLIELPLPDKPDFYVKSSYIKINPENVLVGDSVNIKIMVDNIGRVFPGDSVTVGILASYSDTLINLGNRKLGSFRHTDSLSFYWHPPKDGMVTVKVNVNEENPIDEMDFSDNAAEASFSVFDLNEPNIIKPIDGYYTDNKNNHFLLSDIGYYLDLNLKYTIEINNSPDFSNPIIVSPELVPNEGIVRWEMPSLNHGSYYWRCRLHDGQKYSSWTETRTFRIGDKKGDGYYLSGNQLNSLSTFNMIYSDSSKKLIMNQEVLPPRPSQKTIIDSFALSVPEPGFIPTTITTDGSYIYYANKEYFNHGPSKIYKVGTGVNSVKGKEYGAIPGFEAKVKHSIVWFDDYIYVSTGHPYNLIKVDPVTGDSSLVFVEEGILDNTFGTIRQGSSYLASDGRYVYNIAFNDSLESNKFILRVFDPRDRWKKVKDIKTSATSYEAAFSGCFVADGYFYPFENYYSGHMKRINLETGSFEEEFLTSYKNRYYHDWAYDPENDVVYAAIGYRDVAPFIHKFVGKYKENNANVESKIIGPAVKWDTLYCNVELDGYAGDFQSVLSGYNNVTKEWDELRTGFNGALPLDKISTGVYRYLKAGFYFYDSSVGMTSPAAFKDFMLNYKSLPEIVLRNNHFSFSPDSLMQGYDMTMDFKVENLGASDLTDGRVEFYLNEGDSAIFIDHLKIPEDSSISFSHTFNTSDMLFANKIKAVATTHQEFYTFNNIAEGNYFVARDSLDPVFSIQFDGREIINGDLVSSTPYITMQLADNSPLPLDTSDFYIYLNDRQLSFRNDTMMYSYTKYPDSKVSIDWRPNLPDGVHLLEVLAKDASGNYFDTTAYRVDFTVESDNNIRDIYNYPNPFTDDTWFTFTLTGSEVPDDIRIKVYTVAGRLIRDITADMADMGIKYLCKVHWDGKDEDGDEIANGVYLYKIIAKYGDKTYSEIKKIAKVK